MNLQEWLKSELEYSQDIVHSAVEGARCGCHRATAHEPARKVFERAARNSLPLAAVGACVVPLAAQWARKRNSVRNEVLFGFVGALIGLSAGIALRTRPLVEEMAQEALHNINGVRDAHWLAQHPIDYA
jgi:hypothetical protein